MNCARILNKRAQFAISESITMISDFGNRQLEKYINSSHIFNVSKIYGFYLKKKTVFGN